MEKLKIELAVLLMISLVAFGGFMSLGISDDGSDSSINADDGNELTGDFKIKKPKFIKQVQKELDRAIKRDSPKPSAPVCAQVITSAKNTQTGECKDFPNACIPAGWNKVQSCQMIGLPVLPPPKINATRPPINATPIFSPKPITCKETSRGNAICTQYCSYGENSLDIIYGGDVRTGRGGFDCKSNQFCCEQQGLAKKSNNELTCKQAAKKGNYADGVCSTNPYGKIPCQGAYKSPYIANNLGKTTDCPICCAKK